MSGHIKDNYFPSIYNPKPLGNFSREKVSRVSDKIDYGIQRENQPKGYLPKFHANFPTSNPGNPLKLPPISTFNNAGHNVLGKSSGRGMNLRY